MKLHAEFGSSWPYGLVQGYLLSFPYISLWKTCDPRGGGQILSKGYDLGTHGRGPLDKAIHAKFGKPRPYG